MDAQAMQQNQQPTEQTQPQPEASGGISIALRIATDGSMVVSIGDGDEGGQEAPAADLKTALSMIETIATNIMKGTQSPESLQEDAAYKNEMASPVR